MAPASAAQRRPPELQARHHAVRRLAPRPARVAAHAAPLPHLGSPVRVVRKLRRLLLGVGRREVGQVQARQGHPALPLRQAELLGLQLAGGADPAGTRRGMAGLGCGRGCSVPVALQGVSQVEGAGGVGTAALQLQQAGPRGCAGAHQ
jgi:hypothetical protein